MFPIFLYYVYKTWQNFFSKLFSLVRTERAKSLHMLLRIKAVSILTAVKDQFQFLGKKEKKNCKFNLNYFQFLSINTTPPITKKRTFALSH